MRSIATTCCISGGGPAGIMLGFLLARAGVEVTVLEKWPDFFRDFRGDTIHPSTMQILRELGLLEKFRALPHNETKQVAVHINGEEIVIADFTKLKNVPAFLGFIPQWDFLNFIAAEAKQYPSFHLLMETEVTDLLCEENSVVGVKAKTKTKSEAGDSEEEIEIRAALTIGADGRHSTVREKSGLQLEDLGAPIDVLWFELPRTDDGTATSLGYIDAGKMMVLIDRDTYWQCAFIIQKGSFDALKAQGIEAFKADIQKVAPTLAPSVHALTDWDKVKLLSVAVDHLPVWQLPGLLCIGDSAHAMSPVGGVGINLAVQDAVATANILAPVLTRVQAGKGIVKLSDLQAVQKRRAWPASVIQKAQVYIHVHVIEAILGSANRLPVPWQVRLIQKFPTLRGIPAMIIGVGVRAEHIHTREVR